MGRLSGRECMLICIALVLLIVYIGGVRLAVPAGLRLEAAEQEVRKLQMKKEQTELEISQVAEMRKACEIRKNQCLDNQKEYESVIAETQLEQSVLQCLGRAGLTPVSTFMNRSLEKRMHQQMELTFQTGKEKSDTKTRWWWSL